MLNKIFVMGTISIFILTSISPTIFGLENKIFKTNEILDNQAYYYSNEYGSAKFEFYKELLQIEYTIEEIDKSEREILTFKSPSYSSPIDSPWPMYCHDTRHTGRSPYGKEGDCYKVKWKFWMDDVLKSSPAIDKNGILYVGDFEYCLNAIHSNGTEKWHYKTDGPIQSSPAIGEDGTIYVGSDDGRLYAFNPNGTKKWKAGVGDGWVYSSPVIDENGIIYVASVNGKNIKAFYPNGTTKWDFKTGDLIYDSPAIDENGILYIGSRDSYLYAIYKDNGTLKWKYKTGYAIGGGPTIDDDGTIYFGSNDHYLYALYPDGTLKWKFSVGWDALTSSPALGTDGYIYFGCHAGYIYCLNSSTGKENWRYPTYCNWDHEVSAPVAIDNNGIIYAGDWSGTLFALNPDGTARWKFKTGDAIMVSPVIAEDGTVYITSWDGYLYALEIIDINNNPPQKPTLKGPANGIPRLNYKFTATSTDPDGDNISYFFDWEHEHDNSGWTEFVPSGTSISRRYTFYLDGSYTVKVKAQDEYGADSPWETLDVIIPRKKQSIDNLFLRFLEKHPQLFPILRQILNLK
jgi:outer membrane protein assembly factor BamB